MITSQKQYLAAQEKLKVLKDSTKSKFKTGVPDILKKAAQGQTAELALEIENEIKEYEGLKNFKATAIRIDSIEDLMLAPIRYRLAKNMTIEEFARKVEVHSRQIIRYEEDDYRNATTDTLLKILGKLDIHLSGDLKVS
jgi:hypothetical protein